VRHAPGIPCALNWAKDDEKLGRIAPRECEGVFYVIASDSEAIQFGTRKILDYFRSLRSLAQMLRVYRRQ
jgi:hypothetical protein